MTVARFASPEAQFGLIIASLVPLSFPLPGMRYAWKMTNAGILFRGDHGIARLGAAPPIVGIPQATPQKRSGTLTGSETGKGNNHRRGLCLTHARALAPSRIPHTSSLCRRPAPTYACSAAAATTGGRRQ